MSRPSLLASFCNSRFNSRTREPLLPRHRPGDQQSVASDSAPTDGAPPLADALTANAAVFVVNADTHPTGIGCEVVDPVRHRAAELLDQEKSCTRLLPGALGRYSRPLLRKSPTVAFSWCRRRSPAAVRPTPLVTWLLSRRTRIPVGVAVALRGLRWLADCNPPH